MDSITIELIVTACQLDDTDIWMQGSPEIRINGEKPYSDGDIINIDSLIDSTKNEGEFALFSCCCGIPACSSWDRGIQVTHSESITKWINLNDGKTWNFDKEKIITDLASIRKEVEIYKNFFSNKGIEYVGVGYDWQE